MAEKRHRRRWGEANVLAVGGSSLFFFFSLFLSTGLWTRACNSFFHPARPLTNHHISFFAIELRASLLSRSHYGVSSFEISMPNVSGTFGAEELDAAALLLVGALATSAAAADPCKVNAPRQKQ